MNRAYRLFRDVFNRNIQLRLTCYFLFLLVPLVTVGLLANMRSQQILFEQTTDRTKSALSSSMDYIDLMLQNVGEISSIIASDSNVIKLLDQADPELSPQTVMDFEAILKQLSTITLANHMISQVSIYHAQSHMLVSTIYGGKRIYNAREQMWFTDTAKTLGTGIVYLIPDTRVAGSDTVGSIFGTDSISLVRSMDLYNSSRQPNLLIVSLNKTKLYNLIMSLLPSPNAHIYLYTNDHRLITGSDDKRAYGEEKPGMLTVTMDSKFYKWSLVMVQPANELYGKIDQMKLYTYIIIGVSIILALWISWAVYSGIASPVQKLTQGMKSVGGGDFNVRLENTHQDEFGYLTRSFNQMVNRQRSLIQDFYEQQLRLSRAELIFLQSQINPHFLYNTLDSIYWTAKNYEADEICDMVLNLSKFFRLSLSKGKETFTVEETLEHLNYYISVQRLRFLDHFSVKYDVEEACRQIPVLKLLLQPLVENAILHGLEKKQEGGMLRVAARIEEEMLLLVVEDNGVGIEPFRLAYIRSELEGFLQEDYKELSFMGGTVVDMYGLRNVMSRIRLFYGKACRLSIESREGEGTTIAIGLPLERCKHHFDPAPDKPMKS